MNLNFEQLSPRCQQSLRERFPDLAVKKNKYNAKRTTKNGYSFDSKREADRYMALSRLQMIGDVRFFIRQPTLDIGAGTTYRADFLVFWRDNSFTIEDVKGYQTREFKLKRKLIEDRYPFKIEIL